MTNRFTDTARRAAQKTSGEERTYTHTELVALLRAILSRDWASVDVEDIRAEFAKLGVEL